MDDEAGEQMEGGDGHPAAGDYEGDVGGGEYNGDDGGGEYDGLREISHEEFDPVGTFALAFLYLGLVVVLWLYMYFVEFLGNGPTVVG